MDQEILTCLKIVSMIREGQKLSVRNGVLQLEYSSSGLVSAIKRWLYSDSRHVTMTYVQNILLNALDRRVQPRYLREALQGLNSLKVTYADDVTVVARLTVLEEKIEDYVNGETPEELRRQADSRKRGPDNK